MFKCGSAQYNLGKVRLELMQSTLFPCPLRDLRGGPFGDLQGFCVALPFLLQCCLLIFANLLCSICESLQILASEMNSRNTRNSQSAAFDALSLAPESEGILPQSVSASSVSSVASTAPSMCTSVVSPMSPAFLAAVANAVQQVASVPACSVPGNVADYGGVPAPHASSSQLAAQALSFAASGAGFASSLAAPVILPASGRPNKCVVPTFVSTFSTPIPSLPHSAFPGTLCAALPSSTIGTASLALLPGLHQPFVVGPGSSPVLAKLVSQMVAGKFVELHHLLPSNIVLTEPGPQLLFDRRLVLTSPPKKPKPHIEEISTWWEAFSIYCLILMSYFPHHWKELLQCQLLILRTFHQFSGRLWLSYDRAFRENAATTNLTDWSQLNSTLFSFHLAGGSARSHRDSSDGQHGPHGSASSQIICKSWNWGHCMAPSASCRFTHKCASCHGLHRAAVCPADLHNKPSSSSKRSPDSPPPRSSKSCWV